MATDRTLAILADSKRGSRCSGPRCGQVITWAQLEGSGKRMCFSGAPGRLTVLQTRQREDGKLVEVVPLSENHWATCVDRDQFSRKKG